MNNHDLAKYILDNDDYIPDCDSTSIANAYLFLEVGFKDQQETIKRLQAMADGYLTRWNEAKEEIRELKR